MKRQWLLAFFGFGIFAGAGESRAVERYEQLPDAASLGVIVPEPGVLALLGLGVALLAIVWRRRK